MGPASQNRVSELREEIASLQHDNDLHKRKHTLKRLGKALSDVGLLPPSHQHSCDVAVLVNGLAVFVGIQIDREIDQLVAKCAKYV